MRIYYKPDEEAIKKINPGPTYGLVITDPIEEAKVCACIYAMQDHSKNNIDEVYTQMYIYLDRVYHAVRRKIRKEYYELLKEEGEVSFEHGGGAFGRDIDWDYESTLNWRLKWFTQQAILCPTPDYYENSERFSTKDDNLSEEMDGFVESMEEVCKQEIERELEQFKDREEEE